IAGVIVALVWFSIRLARRVTTGDAAAVADRAGDLKDELKSAWWLTGGARSARVSHSGADGDRGNEFIALLVQRASASAQRLDARQVVPATVPRALLAAVALAVLAAALGWGAPRRALSVGAVHGRVMQSREAANPSVRHAQATEAPSAQNRAAADAEQAAAKSAKTSPRANEVDWASIERAAAALGESEA